MPHSFNVIEIYAIIVLSDYFRFPHRNAFTVLLVRFFDAVKKASNYCNISKENESLGELSFHSAYLMKCGGNSLGGQLEEEKFHSTTVTSTDTNISIN